MTVFNAENKGHIEKKYPLFFGDDLGLFDTVNTPYQEIETLYQQQLAQIWNEFEIDLTQDRMDMQQTPREVSDLMVKTISWQHLADSVAGKSIPALLLKHCTNSELEGMLMIQSFFEIIHSRTYSHIVKQTFTDPNKMLQETYDNIDVLSRSRNIIEIFEELEHLSDDATQNEKYKVMLKAFAALLGLEGIAFMSSFAVTFGVVETDIFQGIGALVALICRDEVLHTRMDHTVMEILLRDEAWKEAFEEVKPEITRVLDDIVLQEMNWADYIFSQGRKVVGLNSELLKEYTLYVAKPLYDALEIPYTWPVIEENPLPYMDAYIDPSKMQSAAQEINITSYNIGAIADDTDGLDLSEFE